MNWVAPMKKAAKTTKTIARAGVCWVTEATEAVKTACSKVTVKKCSLVCPKVLNEMAANAPPTGIVIRAEIVNKTVKLLTSSWCVVSHAIPSHCLGDRGEEQLNFCTDLATISESVETQVTNPEATGLGNW